MNLGQIIAAAKRRWRDTANDVISDPQWTEYANQAYKEFLFNADFLIEETLTVVNATAGERSVDLPANTLSVMAVRDQTNGIKLRPIDGHRTAFDIWQNIEDSTGQPEYYRPIGTALHLFPIPVSDIDLEILHRAEPPDMADE